MSTQHENAAASKDSAQKDHLSQESLEGGILTASRPGDQQHQIQLAANESAPVQQLMAMQAAADKSPEVLQLMALQDGANEAMQRKEAEGNKGGLPAQLRGGIEQLSGVSMDGVNVHMNSSKPAQMQAHAYAQGSDIHVAPGQEQHLPHEAWHVAQQRQGRVQPTTQVGGNPVNDSPALEQEADSMGAKAMQMKVEDDRPVAEPGGKAGALQRAAVGNSGNDQPIQRVVINLDPSDRAITDSARLHLQRDNRFERQTGRQETELITGDFHPPLALPLSRIGLEEEITIIAHGTPAMGGDVPRVAGKTALELFNHLVGIGLTPEHTGMINLSNCTSAWDRKGTGSFQDLFVVILQQNGYDNHVTGYESFTESVDIDTELEVPKDAREPFLAHKITERYLMALMNLHPRDAVENGGAVLKQIHRELVLGAEAAKIEATDFMKKDDRESRDLGGFYIRLRGLILEYLGMAGDKFSEKLILNFQTSAMDLMKEYGFNNMGARLHDRKVEAIPVLAGGGM